jgi:KGK domain
MNNQSNQIIPDSNAVVRCLDPDLLGLLDSHGTFTLDELVSEINPQTGVLMSTEQVNLILKKIRVVPSYGPPDFLKEINDIVKVFGNLLSEQQSGSIFDQIRTRSSYGSADFIRHINNAVIGEIATASIISILIDGTNISLLQPDSKGWQKGKLKLSFEFIPEVTEIVASQEKLVADANSSPLDEIRHLSNGLASMTLIEQN